MTDVLAGTDQPNVAAGDMGIVTLWVRAGSDTVAIAVARAILANRRYASIGELHTYAEVVDDDPLGYATDDQRANERHEDWVLAGYDAMKERALLHADGLHEVWLGAITHQFVRQSQIA